MEKWETVSTRGIGWAPEKQQDLLPPVEEYIEEPTGETDEEQVEYTE